MFQKQRTWIAVSMRDNTLSWFFYFSISVYALQEVRIKRMTVDDHYIPASDLTELHDGLKYQTPTQFSSVFYDYYLGNGFYMGGGFRLVPEEYTVRIEVASALITSIQLYGEANAEELTPGY